MGELSILQQGWSAGNMIFSFLINASEWIVFPWVMRVHKKTRPGGGKTAPAALQIRRGQDDPGRETPRTPALELGTGAMFLGPLPNRPGPSWQHSPLGLVPRSWGRYLPGRAQANNTAQVIKSTARVFFSAGGEIRPGGGSNPPPAGAASCAQTDWANNLGCSLVTH